MSGDNKEKEYVVRGALIACTMGTHPRRLNLRKSNGSYVKNHPLICKEDCKVEENISFFGVCKSGTPPAGAKEIRLEGYVPEGETKSGGCVQGIRCCPDILEEWKCTQDKVCISGELPIVTMDSYLVCSCGGIIEPKTSGQEYEESATKGEEGKGNEG